MHASDYTDVVSQALELKRTGRELEEARRLNETLQERIAAKERAAEESSIRNSLEVARIERQRDEFRDLLQEKTRELALSADHLESIQRELALAHDTIARLRADSVQKTANPFHVQERPENAYDRLFACMVKSSADRQRLVDRYRNAESYSSNMLWQTVVDDTMLQVRGWLFRLGYSDVSNLPVESMVRTMVEVETLQPAFLLYILRQLEYEEAKPKRLTKRQIAVFQQDMDKAMDAMVHAWAITRQKDKPERS